MNNPNPPDPKTKTPRTDAKAEEIAKLPIHSWPIEWKVFARTLELENQSLTRRLEEVEKEKGRLRRGFDALGVDFHQMSDELTALRTAAEGAAILLADAALRLQESEWGGDNDCGEQCSKTSAALRAELGEKQ